MVNLRRSCVRNLPSDSTGLPKKHRKTKKMRFKRRRKGQVHFVTLAGLYAALCPNDTSLVMVFINYAKVFQSKRKRDAWYAYLLKAKDAAKTISPPSKYRRAVYSELSDYYYSLQHGDSTLYYDLAVLDKAVDTLEQVIASKRVVYNNIGNTVKALESYQHALRLLDKSDHPAQKAGLLNNARSNAAW